ncbi:hypothetical protein K9N50_05465 [bacterium]|nr:hypothetical protein [bacterium]
MAIVSLLSIGCSEDDNPSGPQHDMALVGEWDVTHWVTYVEGDTVIYTESQIDSMNLIWTLTMDDDGSVEQITNISGPLLTMPGTWETSQNQLSLTLTRPTGGVSTLVYDYEVDENLLTLDWQLPAGTKMTAEFTKQ